MKTFASIAVLSMALTGAAFAADDASKMMDNLREKGAAALSSDQKGGSAEMQSGTTSAPGMSSTGEAAGTTAPGSGMTPAEQQAATDSETKASGDVDAKAEAGSASTAETGAQPSGQAGTQPMTTDRQSSLEGGQTQAQSQAQADMPKGNWHEDADLVRRVQTQLKDGGYDVGQVDGMYGPMTREALMAYQKDKGFQATGEIDQNLLAEMKIGSDTQQAATPNEQRGAGAPVTTEQPGQPSSGQR